MLKMLPSKEFRILDINIPGHQNSQLKAKVSYKGRKTIRRVALT